MAILDQYLYCSCTPPRESPHRIRREWQLSSPHGRHCPSPLSSANKGRNIYLSSPCFHSHSLWSQYSHMSAIFLAHNSILSPLLPILGCTYHGIFFKNFCAISPTLFSPSTNWRNSIVLNCEFVVYILTGQCAYRKFRFLALSSARKQNVQPNLPHWLHDKIVNPALSFVHSGNLIGLLSQGVQSDWRADGAGRVQLHHPGPPLPRHLLQEAPHTSRSSSRGWHSKYSYIPMHTCTV